jgi:DNA-binding MarR family transcriptional regulator
MAQLSDDDFSALLRTRRELRRFLRFSENAAREAGITPAQHQLLLAVRGRLGPDGPRIRDLAEALFVAHHSAVELIDRSVAAGLVQRHTDTRDQRVVRVRLTEKGERILNELTPAHLAELSRLRSAFSQLPDRLPGSDDPGRELPPTE